MRPWWEFPAILLFLVLVFFVLLPLLVHLLR